MVEQVYNAFLGCDQKVTTDTRNIAKNDLFFALKGPNFNGNKFAEKALELGAKYAVIDEKEYFIEGKTFLVENVLETLQNLARHHREKINIPVVAITGTNGKTTTKELLGAVLTSQYNILITKGNLNNHIGVPLTLLQLNKEHEIAVIEMGASGAGEIAYLCTIAKPDITLVNNIQHAHIEGFGSIEGVASAKAEIYSGLDANGTAVVNLDLSWSQQWLKSLTNHRCLTFSTEHKDADIYADNIEALVGGCYRFELCSGGHKLSLDLPMPGLHSVKNAVAAAACAVASGIGLEQIARGLSAVKPVSGRLNSYQLDEDITLIDDTYNANPDSFKAAIDVLSSSEGHRVLVMGDMAELGEEAMQMHEEIGRYAQEKGIDALYSVGLLSAVAANQFGGTHYQDKNQLIAAITDFLAKKTKTTILIKGSRSSGMDEVVKTLSNKEIS